MTIMRSRGVLPLATLVLAATLTFFVALAHADPADIDPSFSQDGRVNIDNGGVERVFAMALQPDGKIVVAGDDSPNNTDMFIARLNANGSLDTSFDTDGKLTLDNGGIEQAYAVVVQPDGKIVVSGQTSVNNDALVYRLNSNGSFDTNFDTDGKLTLDNGGFDFANALALQPDGKIVVAGTAQADAIVYRLNTNGSLDLGFDGDGKRPIDSGGSEFGQAVVLQPDGKIVVAGFTTVNNNGAVYRLNTDGAFDTSFDGDGAVGIDSGGTERANAVTLQPNGKILVAGFTTVNNNGALYRLNTNGSFDTSFDTDGAVGIDSGGTEYLYGVAAQPNEKIVVDGQTTVANDAAVYRLLSNGAFDTGFDTDGALGIDSGGTEIARAVALQPDGKILIAGFTSVNGDAVVYRLQGDPRPGAPSGGTTFAPASATCAGKKATIVGTAGRDSIRGTSKRDIVQALEGNDTIRGLRGNDIICGGPGKDKESGGTGNDKLYGDAGNDNLIGNIGQDTLRGGSGGDTLKGGAGRDKLLGGPGKDRLRGGSGRDKLLGGPGKDSQRQ